MKKKRFKIATALLAITMLSACSTADASKNRQEKPVETEFAAYPDAYKEINLVDVLEAVSVVDIAYNPGDVKTMTSKSTDIILATVISIDGGSNVNELTGEYVYPYTFGKLQVHEVYKGNLSKDQEIEYVRMGGIVPYNAYLNSLTAEQREKIAVQGGARPAYVKMMFEDDIEIEVGKTYLVYLCDSKEGNVSKENAFAMIGWQGGLREVRGVDDLQAIPASEAQIEVYNNYTQTWESLTQVVTE